MASSVGLTWAWSWKSARSRHSSAEGSPCSRARTVCDDSCVGTFVHSLATAIASASANDSAGITNGAGNGNPRRAIPKIRILSSLSLCVSVSVRCFSCYYCPKMPGTHRRELGAAQAFIARPPCDVM